MVQSYITKMLEEAGPGMKVMLLDADTTPIVSLAFPQSVMMRQEVYLFEKLQARPAREDMKHLKCVVVLRPTEQSLNWLCNELAHPRYGTYHLHFTHFVSKSGVKQLAEADMYEVVRDVKEVYIDFLPLGAHLYSLSFPNPLKPLGSRWDETALSRSGQAITALLLSLKLCPVIRYQGGSGPAQLLAETVRQIMSKEGSLFDTGVSDSSPVLLLLDRREDPVTPLLTQWTYQAMVHELIGINNHRVNLSGAPGVTKDLQDIVLSSSQDEFYAANVYSNFGEIGQTIKNLMDDFQNKAKSHQQLESIADMKNFVENYPQFKKMSGTVSKHVTLVSELSRLVSTRNLLQVSEVEQELSVAGDSSAMLKQVSQLVQREDILLQDAMRLIMLYSLRFEGLPNNGTRQLLNYLRKKGGEREARLAQNILRFAGQNSRHGQLFEDQNNTTRNITGKLFRGLKGVENVYTQHTPVMKQVIEDCVKGKLKNSAFPHLGQIYEGKVKTVVIFVIGGFAYEEACTVSQLNTSLEVQIVMGGTSVLNSSSFIEQMDHNVSTSQLDA